MSTCELDRRSFILFSYFGLYFLGVLRGLLLFKLGIVSRCGGGLPPQMKGLFFGVIFRGHFLCLLLLS